MSKGIHLQSKPDAWRGRKKIGLAASAAAILLAAASGSALSQGVSQRPVVGEEALQTAATAPATPLSLTKAIELALEGSPEVAAATRQW